MRGIRLGFWGSGAVNVLLQEQDSLIVFQIVARAVGIYANGLIVEPQLTAHDAVTPDINGFWLPFVDIAAVIVYAGAAIGASAVIHRSHRAPNPRNSHRRGRHC